MRTLSWLLAPCLATVALADTAPSAQRASFSRSVANIQYAALVLKEDRPGSIQAAPTGMGRFFYGLVVRRLPGEGPRESGNSVAFAAVYSGETPIGAWIDANLNQTLADDRPVTFSSYPPIPGARSFIADLSWHAPFGKKSVPIDWKVRVILEPRVADREPVARIQHVYAMVGSATIEGRPHRAFLLDGNGDGLYGREFFDGVFIDLDDDGHFTIDQMSPEFGPVGAPFQMGSHLYEVESVAVDGKWLILRQGEKVAANPPPAIGELAPDFVHRDTEGRQIRLSDLRGHPVIVHFWASWCGSSVVQAQKMLALRDRFRDSDLRILSISYDTDRMVMEAFRRDHMPGWPTSFSGRMLWEDPVGRLYQARWPGSMFLIAPDGRLDSTDDDPEQLAQRLTDMLGAR